MPSHAAAEERFRRLVADAGLPAPDVVSYEERSLTFFWTERKVAVVVDLDGEAEDGAPPPMGGPGLEPGTSCL